jgi:uncharacterized protein
MSSENSSILSLLERLVLSQEALLERLAAPASALSLPDWSAAHAFRCSGEGQQVRITPVQRLAPIALDDLQDVATQKARLVQNTLQFLDRKPANNVLLSGARGTGKSSLIRALLHAYAPRGLRLIEMDKQHLLKLPELVDALADRPERFIVFSDDLSFEEGDAHYKALKSVLDGGLVGTASNVLLYATSNRRHLLPETMRDNLSYKHTEDGELHPGEGVEEKISLSERFGLWLSFYPFSQEEYLRIVAHWLGHFELSFNDTAREEALVFALERGSRSGRVAFQFAKDFAGRSAK